MTGSSADAEAAQHARLFRSLTVVVDAPDGTTRFTECDFLLVFFDLMCIACIVSEIIATELRNSTCFHITLVFRIRGCYYDPGADSPCR